MQIVGIYNLCRIFTLLMSFSVLASGTGSVPYKKGQLIQVSNKCRRSISGITVPSAQLGIGPARSGADASQNRMLPEREFWMERRLNGKVLQENGRFGIEAEFRMDLGESLVGGKPPNEYLYEMFHAGRLQMSPSPFYFKILENYPPYLPKELKAQILQKRASGFSENVLIQNEVTWYFDTPNETFKRYGIELRAGNFALQLGENQTQQKGKLSFKLDIPGGRGGAHERFFFQLSRFAPYDFSQKRTIDIESIETLGQQLREKMMDPENRLTKEQRDRVLEILSVFNNYRHQVRPQYKVIAHKSEFMDLYYEAEGKVYNIGYVSIDSINGRWQIEIEISPQYYYFYKENPDIFEQFVSDFVRQLQTVGFDNARLTFSSRQSLGVSQKDIH